MRRSLTIFAVLLLFAYSSAFAQLKQQQSWQAGTVSGDAITNIQCSLFLLPSTKGALLSEPAPIVTDGEMAHSMRSAHPVKIMLQPESGITDSLDSITGCSIDGVVIQIRMADEGESVTVVHGTAANDISTPDGTNLVMSGIKRIYTFQRTGGVWVYEGGGSGGGGSSGGSVLIGDGQQLSLAAVDYLNANEGLIMPPTDSCAAAITSGQMCYDRDDKRWCQGTGTGITCGTGSAGGGAGTADEVFDSDPVVDGRVGEVNAAVFKGNPSGGTCVKIFEDVEGMVVKGYTDCGTIDEDIAAPTEIDTLGFLPGAFDVDATHCQYLYSPTVNTLKQPTAIKCADHDSATITLHIMMKDRWDGVTLRVYTDMHTKESTPAGDIVIDWTGYCVVSGGANGGASWAAENSNGVMTIDLDGNTQHDSIFAGTVGNVPLSGCTGSGKKSLWLRGQVNATSTTADDSGTNPALDDHLFQGFQLEYGFKAFSD